MPKKSEKSKKAAKPKKSSVRKNSTAKPKGEKGISAPKSKGKATGKKARTKKPEPKKTTRKKSSSQAASKRDSEMLHELEKEIHSKDEQVCLGAVERLGSLKHPDATRILTIALTDSRYMVRIHAAAQLGERKDKKSVDALIDLLNDNSVFIRQTAAGALENIGGVKARKAISVAEKEGKLLDELPEGKRLGE
ncbi:MAG: HEAT repeat domain-containing protein [Candidatus Thorarchaeota archaeon]|nr:HEAT repeat domain-containing protein [Candidatus Thorarchaeota archaeon]